MAEERTKRRLAAILAADVVGYTRLMEADESDAFVRVKTQHKELFEPEIERHNGRVFKLMGDGLLAEFASVVDAVECAIVLQREMAVRNEGMPSDRRIDARIGVTLGDVIVDGEDRYGDGVNIATRLEQLADPGGIAISGVVYDQLLGKVDHSFEFKGEQHVKNISRPVRIYRMKIAGGANATPPSAPRRRTQPLGLVAGALALSLACGMIWWFRTVPMPASAKPAVAVLPFDNYGSDEETIRLADGLTEDIITDLARFEDIDVIARNSAEVYKGRSTDIRQIADALRVGYVLEGSIQHRDGRVRITAQLIDATSNSHLWSQRWDRPDKDLFAVQSEIAEQVTDELGRDTGLILKAERNLARRKPPGSLSAYESYLLGNEKLAQPDDPANLQEAVLLFKRATELDPYLTRAWIGISTAYNIISYSGAEFDKWHRLASEAAEHAVLLDPDDAEAHSVRAAILVSEGDIIRAKSEAETALRLAPGSVAILTPYAGWAATLGEAARGGEVADHVIRLDPNYQPQSVPSLAYGYFAADRYDDSLHVLERLPTDGYTPDMWVVHPGALAAIGRLEESVSWVKEALKRFPDLTAEGWANSPGYADDERQRFLRLMKLAGFPPCAKPDALAGVANPVRLPECANAQGGPD